MSYHNYFRSNNTAYDKNTHVYCYDHNSLFPIIRESDDWNNAINDSFGCTFVLPIDFLNKSEYSELNKQLVDTNRIDVIEYINNIFYPMKSVDEYYERFSIRCVKIHLSDKQQTNILMREADDADLKSIPYEHVSANYVLAPERYPNIPLCCDEENGEALSNHIHIEKYRQPIGNAPNILLMIGDILRGIDDLPAVLPTDERPRNALVIDLEYWFPEYLRAKLIASQNYIIYGTALGRKGEKQRLKRILKMPIYCPRLLVQMNVMLKNDLSLDTSLSSTSLMPDNLQKTALLLGGATALRAAATTVIGATPALGRTMTRLVTTKPTLLTFLAGLGGFWGASKLLKNNYQESTETPEWLKEEKSALEQQRVQELKEFEKEELSRKKEIDSLKESHLSEEERIHEENRLRGLHSHEDEEWLDEAWKNVDEYNQALECVNYRRKLDSIVFSIMHESASKVNYEKIIDLDELLLNVPKNIYKDNYLWLHNIKEKELKNINRIIEDIQDIKRYLPDGSDSQEDNLCVEPIEQACPRCAETLDANFAAGIGFVSNVCYALLKILRQYEIRYREKHTIYTTQALEEAKIQKAKAEAAQREAEENIGYICHNLKGQIPSTVSKVDEVLKDNQISLKSKRLAKMVRSDLLLLQETMSRESISYRPIPQDLLDDIQNANGSPYAEYLGTIILEAIIQVMPNTCNPRFDENAFRNYFGDDIDKAQVISGRISSIRINDPKTLVDLLNEYFFDFKLIISESCDNLLINNQHHSVTNLRIFLNELFHNAVKYVSELPKEKRMVEFYASIENDCLLFKISNSYVENQLVSRTYGGTKCLDRLANGFGAKVVQEPNTKNTFSLSYRIPIKWSGK